MTKTQLNFMFQIGGAWSFFWWGLTLPPVTYATDQVHFKHEQPQVLLIESHVTIGAVQQTQDAASVL